MKKQSLLTLVLFCVSTGCVKQNPQITAPQKDISKPKPVDDHFLDLTYILQPSEGFEQVEGTTVQLSFAKSDDGSIEMLLYAGCNNLNAEITLKQGRLNPVNGIMFTEKGCDRVRHVQDEWLLVFMTDTPQFEASGDTLTLTGNSAHLVFLNKKIANPDRPLTGRVWTSTYFLTKHARAWLSVETQPTLSFSQAGTVTIFDSCNQMLGDFTVQEDTIILNNMTIQATNTCTDENVLELSGHYHNLFVDGPLLYSIDANFLEIKRDEFGIGALTE